MNKEFAAIVGLIVLIIALLIFGPLMTIWSLNMVFPLLAIPYNFWTWAGILWIQATFLGSKINKSSD